MGHGLGAHLQRLPLRVGRLRHPDEAEEEMPAKLVRSLHLQEDVHEDLKAHKVDVLKVKNVCYELAALHTSRHSCLDRDFFNPLTPTHRSFICVSPHRWCS